MTRANVLIVGGGIGGLSAAIALRQEDYDVTVFEKQADEHSSVYGVGIIQPSNALRALDVIGCAQACIDSGFPAPAWGALYDAAGNFLHPMPGVRIEGTTFPPMNGITRPRLHEILTERAHEVGANIRYSTVFEMLVDSADGVDVTLADGSVEHFDIVVGADGVRSQVRPYVLDAELVPRYIGQSSYRVNIPREPEMDRILLQAGPHGMAGIVPIGPDLAYLFFNAKMERSRGATPAELADQLREHLKPFGGFAGRVRDDYITDSTEVVLRPEEEMIAPAPWHRGRVVLMGDAVHSITPHLGQGAAQAIEDGVVLADCLANNDDIETAFAEFTERRYERCKLIVETSLAIGEKEMGLRPDFDNIGATQNVLERMAEPI